VGGSPPIFGNPIPSCSKVMEVGVITHPSNSRTYMVINILVCVLLHQPDRTASHDDGMDPARLEDLI